MERIGWVHCEKFQRDFVARTFARSARFAPSFARQPNSPKCTQMVRNAPKLEFMVQRGGTGALGAKNSDTTSWHELFSLIAPVQPKLLRVLYSNEMIPNAPKHQETHQNKCLGSNEVDQVCSLQKCPTRLRWPNLCINCTNSACFAPSFVQQ